MGCLNTKLSKLRLKRESATSTTTTKTTNLYYIDSFVKRYFSSTQVIYVAVCNGSSSLRMKQHIQELKVRLGVKFEISQPNSKKKRGKGPCCSGWLSFSRSCSNYIKSLVLVLRFCKRDINYNHQSFSPRTRDQGTSSNKVFIVVRGQRHV